MWSTVRSAYAWGLLCAIMLPLFPIAWLYRRATLRSDPAGDALRVFTAGWISSYTRLTPLYQFRLEGREHLPKQRPYVLVANHSSGLDVLALLLLATPARFVAEHWLLAIPLAGRLFRDCRHIPVTIGRAGSGREALAVAATALAEGTPVAIFPEGKINPAGLGELRPGAFVLAQRAGVPIVPVLIEGAAQAWQPGEMVVRGEHRIRIAVLEAVPAEDVAALDPARLTAHVAELLEKARSAARDENGAGPNTARSL